MNTNQPGVWNSPLVDAHFALAVKKVSLCSDRRGGAEISSCEESYHLWCSFLKLFTHRLMFKEKQLSLFCVNYLSTFCCITNLKSNIFYNYCLCGLRPLDPSGDFVLFALQATRYSRVVKSCYSPNHPTMGGQKEFSRSFISDTKIFAYSNIHLYCFCNTNIFEYSFVSRFYIRHTLLPTQRLPNYLSCNATSRCTKIKGEILHNRKTKPYIIAGWHNLYEVRIGLEDFCKF